MSKLLADFTFKWRRPYSVDTCEDSKSRKKKNNNNLLSIFNLSKIGFNYLNPNLSLNPIKFKIDKPINQFGSNWVSRKFMESKFNMPIIFSENQLIHN